MPRPPRASHPVKLETGPLTPRSHPHTSRLVSRALLSWCTQVWNRCPCLAAPQPVQHALPVFMCTAGVPSKPVLLSAQSGADFIALRWTSDPPQPEGVVWSAQLTGPLPATTTTSVDDLATFQHNFTSLAIGKYSVRLAATVKNGEVYGASASVNMPEFVLGTPGPAQFVGTPAQVAGKLRLKWTLAANDPDPTTTMQVPNKAAVTGLLSWSLKDWCCQIRSSWAMPYHCPLSEPVSSGLCPRLQVPAAHLLGRRHQPSRTGRCAVWPQGG